MAKAQFSYEVRSGVAQPVWVEDYVVRTSDGKPVGTVGAVLEREGQRLLVVESGLAPVAQDRRAVPWSDVEQVDHEALAVWLRLDERAFLEDAVELDPSLGVEEGEAEAVRIRETPEAELPSAQVHPRGPVDRPLLRIAILCAGLGAFVFFALAAASTAADSAGPMVFAIVPAALLVAAAVLAFRAYRNPYERRGLRKS